MFADGHDEKTDASSAQKSALRLIHAYKQTSAMTPAASSMNDDDPRYGSGIQKVGTLIGALSMGNLMQPWYESATVRRQMAAAETYSAQEYYYNNSLLFETDLTKQLSVEKIHQLITSPDNITKVVHELATVAESGRLFVNSSSMNSSVLATNVTEDDVTGIEQRR